MFTLAFLLLAACGPDVSITKQQVDADSDGYDSTVDCDDSQVDVNPDAPELCDGQDNDCDGAVDEDATDAPTFHPDGDGDAYGDPAQSATACEAPAGWVADGTDCADTEPAAFPGNPEVCDGVDNDCDGATDEDASDAVTVYVDADGDGYGDPGTAQLACAAGEGEVTIGADCDDDAPAIHPDAAEADCTDPTDYNCDGSVGYQDADGDGVAACRDCDDADAGVADELTWYRDIDGDGYAGDSGTTLVQCEAPVGYAALTGDCDDYDIAAHPGATEVCDPADVDEDCDGTADDADPSTDPATWSAWHRDADADGYGDPTATISLCDAPAGWVADAEDCDDTNGSISPSATEVCDPADVDEDCDGLADDASAEGASSWYRDADADGYGGTTSLTACDAPAGYVPTGTDCDDATGTVNPGATEVCDAADVDEDCDGLADDADPTVTGTRTAHPDADGDGYGATTSTSACDIPSGSVTDATDCDDADATVNPAATERCDAADIDEDCDGLADDADPTVTGTSAWYRDADADGYGGTTRSSACDAPAGYLATSTDCDDDAATTHPGALETCDDGVDQDCSGADDVCPSLGVYGSLVDTDADAVLYGTANGANMGVSIVTGDFDGDGVGDLVASARGDTTMSAASGVVYGYTTVPTSGSHEADSVDTFSYYNTSSTYTGLYGGMLGNLGDLDEDGRDDLFIQARYQYGFVHLGGDTGAFEQTTADVTASCYLGREGGSVASGTPAWICGHMYGGSTAGVVYVYAGTASTPSATFNGETVGDYAGQGVAGGDVDGDGFDDLWMGAPTRDVSTTNTGSVYLVYGPASGTASLAGADVTFRGGTANDYLGSNLVSPGDLNGDGHDDIAIGKLGGDLGGTESGTVHIITTPGSGTVTSLAGITIVGDDPDDYLGQYDPAFGDANGDGVVDILLGGDRNDDGGPTAGSAWVVYGPLSGTIDLTTSADAEILGTTPYGYLGTGPMFLPDVNGDGADEIVVSSYAADVDGLTRRGAAWIFLGG